MRTVKPWGLIALILAVQVALAQGPERRMCASRLTELGARPPDADLLPGVWEVPIGALLPFLATIEGVKDLSPASFGYGPPGSAEREATADPSYPVAATCYRHLLFFSKNSGQYLVTVDLLQKKKLSGVGGLFGGPSQVWKINDAVYAINLYYSDIAYEGLILNVTTGEVLFYAGPSRYGDLKVALVVPEKAVLLENYTWGAPSARGSVGLSLFDLTDGARRRTHEELPSCLVKLPPNAYEWRFILRREGIILQAKIEKPGPPIAPSPDPTPTPPLLALTPPSNAPERPPPAPASASPGLKDRANGVTAEFAETRLPKNCRALTDALLN